MSDRVRVAVISEPGKAGVKRHVVDLLQGINVEKFDVCFIYSLVRSDSDYRSEIDGIGARGIKCVEVPMDAPLSVSKDFAAFKQIRQELKQFKPEILHLHSSKAGGLGRLVSRFVSPRPKVVYTPNAMACYLSKMYWVIEVALGTLTDRAVAVSNSEKRDWLRWKIPGAKISSVVPNGFAAPTADPIVHRDVSGGATWTFGACGRICRQKNALLMFQTAIHVLEKDPNSRFVWIGDYGDDEESHAVKQFLESKGKNDRLVITGWVSDVQRYLRELDIFCMISRYEGLSYVLAEAQLLALPVLGVDAPGVIDLVHHETTGIVSEPNIDKLTADLFRMRDDVLLRKRLGESARQEILTNYTVRHMVDGVEKVYRELVPR